jgi:hypothetical protein
MLRDSASSRGVSDRTAVIARFTISKLTISKLKIAKLRTAKFITAGLLTSLLVASLASPLLAQRASQSLSAPVSAHESVAAYNVARELALDGTVQEVVSQREIGSPAGLHLILTGGIGRVDAHLGPFLTEETREALHLGLPIHVVGEMKDFHGRPILLARLISFGGRTVIVRNTHGALIQYASHPTIASPRTVESANGGAR